MRSLLSLLSLLCLTAAASAQTILAQPYLQPGPQGALEATDELRVLWVTDQTPGRFTVEYAPKGFKLIPAKVESAPMDFTAPAAKTPVTQEKDQHYIRYTAALPGLPLDTTFTYVVKLDGKVVREQTTHTRVSAGKPTRFIMIGDLADGKASQNVIAYQMSLQKPHYTVLLGDIIYPSGRLYHYMKYFWSTYTNPNEPSEKNGAPLMATVPFYAVLGNHDAYVGKITAFNDAYAAYYFFNAPQNGLAEGVWNTALPKSEAATKFRSLAGKNYPALGFYSFDYGAAHVVVIDNSGGGKSDDPAVMAWLDQDLKATKQPWKFVTMHVPPFQVTVSHYGDQRQRKFAPIFEANGVDVVFAGHVHNFQRSKPLRFLPATGVAAAVAAKPVPDDPKAVDPAGAPRTPPSYVNGAFTLDETFDGAKHTHPKGVIYVVQGGGGAKLYTGTVDKNLAKLPNGGKDNFVPFNAKYYETLHSFSLIDLTAKKFEMRTINEKGEEIDRCVIEK
jgi:predicted phosphodiesterase